MKYVLNLLIITLLFTACQSKKEETKAELPVASATEDFVCVPGERVGSLITATTSLEELKAKLGDAVIAKDSIYIGEGYYEVGTTIYKGTPNELQVLWKDTLNFKNPSSVLIGGSSTANATATQWHTDSGIKIGTSLKELEKINGKAFLFSGFGWDYGGQVVDWQAGKLGLPDGISYVAVELTYNYEDEKLNKLAENVMGDSSFLSSQSEAQQLNPVVLNFLISFK